MDLQFKTGLLCERAPKRRDRHVRHTRSPARQPTPRYSGNATWQSGIWRAALEARAIRWMRVKYRRLSTARAALANYALRRMEGCRLGRGRRVS